MPAPKLNRYWWKEAVAGKKIRQASIHLRRDDDGGELTAIYNSIAGWGLMGWIYIGGEPVHLGRSSSRSEVSKLVAALKAVGG